MRYDAERCVIILSVGELCSRAFLPMHLDLRPGAWKRSPERAEMGREAHKRIQKNGGADYRAEVSLCNTTLYDEICYEISGRADGVICGERTVVEEIKTVGARAFEGTPGLFHEAQAMCYAYFLCQQEQLSEIEVRLTLCRGEDDKTRSFQRICSAEELKSFYFDLLSKVAYRASFLRDRCLNRLPSVQSGRFPYSAVREGQDIMLRECYRAIRHGKRLFIEAPTGTGKTVSSLYPAVRALGEGACDKIFYLTAKASTRREAYGAAARIYEAGSHLRTVVLTAREQICANEGARSDTAGISRHCHPDDCPRARNFYEKCQNAIAYLLERQNGFPRLSVEEVAGKFDICPYEFQLELSEYCDIVICDYNYVFDPMVYLRRYFDGDTDGQYVFLVDEAHNLVDRAGAMYSAELKCSELVSAYRLMLSLEDEALAERFMPLERLIVAVQGCRKLCADNLFTDDEGTEHGFYLNGQQMFALDREVEACLAFLEKWTFLHRGELGETELLRVSSMLKRYRMVSDAYDSHFTTFVEVCGEEITVRQICRDASRLLDATMSRARASVLFSATLTPTDYFADILGGGKDAVRLSLPSPFDPKRTCLVAATGVSTRFGDREKSVKKLASLIAATVSGKAGTYMFYFPSYDYMNSVYEVFVKRYPQVETVRQEKHMNLQAREAFLDSFTDSGSLRVGFCVLGGSFSEGVDLPGRRLIGVGIVGVGLPGISNERNLLKEYYDDTRESGYDYAYTYPGMNRVLQAAGRVIRRESDCGVIVLMDDRYATPQYQKLFPDHWSHLRYAGNAPELANIMSEFWNFIDKKPKK